MFCFDGVTLLLIQFRAQAEAELAHKNCPIDVMVIPYDNSGVNYGDHIGCAIRYGLYRLLTAGLRRCIGIKSPSLSIAGYPRHFEYFSGYPYWITAAGRQAAHPLGYEQAYDEDNHAYKWTLNGEFENWDTITLESAST
jgi:hypothetical protein